MNIKSYPITHLTLKAPSRKNFVLTLTNSVVNLTSKKGQFIFKRNIFFASWMLLANICWWLEPLDTADKVNKVAFRENNGNHLSKFETGSKIKHLYFSSLRPLETVGLHRHEKKKAIISLKPKTGKDTGQCQNFRPISVLNSQERIYTSVLCKRHECSIQDLIDKDQCGFIKRHQTQDNITWILNTD